MMISTLHAEMSIHNLQTEFAERVLQQKTFLNFGIYQWFSFDATDSVSWDR